MTENKELITPANIMIENNLDKTEVKVEQEIIQEGFENTYFKQIYRRYTQFECEKPLVWSMKQTCNITRNCDIEYHYLFTFKPS